jgi:hypothetical protein
MTKSNIINIKFFALQNSSSKNAKARHTGRKYLQYISLTKDVYPENSHNSKTSNSTLKMGGKVGTDTLQEKSFNNNHTQREHNVSFHQGNAN